MRDTTPPGVLTRAVAYGPTAALIAVALVQLWGALAIGRLTPAKGGGFGLFSTVDKLNNRHVRAYLRSGDAGPERPLRLPAALAHDARMQMWALKAFPTDDRLRTFASRVDQGVDRASTDALRIEIVKMTFDATTLEARFVPVADVVSAPTHE